jgi:hypothetical protein
MLDSNQNCREVSLAYDTFQKVEGVKSALRRETVIEDSNLQPGRASCQAALSLVGDEVSHCYDILPEYFFLCFQRTSLLSPVVAYCSECTRVRRNGSFTVALQLGTS